MCPILAYIQFGCYSYSDPAKIFTDEEKDELIAELWKDRLSDNLYEKAVSHVATGNPEPYEGPWYVFNNDLRVQNINATVKRLTESLEVSN